MKFVTVIGARPQIIKAAALSRAIKQHFKEQIREIIVHTGQHYDQNMSQVFIDELGIPAPDYNLNIGSATHGVQTARMIEGIEQILLKEKPDYLILYGDTNSTLAGAVAASKIHIPIAHIEAGLRSFNKSMPEEINRIMCDHASTLLFSPTKTGYENLLREGFIARQTKPYTADHPGLFHCGDVMYDNSLFFKDLAQKKSTILKTLSLENTPFILSTIHRDNNTDNPERLTAIFNALLKIAEKDSIKMIIPLHPRTAKLLPENLNSNLYNKIKNSPFIRLIPPVSFLDMILLESSCEMIMTDSGGVQKEAFFFNKPVIVLRSETEWKEIVDEGCGIIADASETKIEEAYEHFKTMKGTLKFPSLFGDGQAARFICQTILANG